METIEITMEWLLDGLCPDILKIISSYEPHLFMIGECDKIYDRYLPITKEIIDNDNFNNTFFKYYKKKMLV